MQQEMPVIVTVSVARQIAEALRNAILSGHLAVDQRLPTEEELAQTFGVSRPTIREALKRLAAEHLVRSRRGPTGGNFVKRPSVPEVSASLASSMRLLTMIGEFTLDDIAEARLELDKLCCRLAVQRATTKDITAMRQELTNQQRADVSDVEFCASDVNFHRLLINASHNSLLEFIMLAMGEGLQPVTNLVVFRFRERSVITDQHTRLVDAIENRNIDTALKVISEQNAYLRDKYREARKWKRGSGNSQTIVSRQGAEAELKSTRRPPRGRF